jgi:hypothetical protein
MILDKVNTIDIQSIQSVQVVQFVHVGVQTGLGIQPLFVGVGLGVGVGVGVT